MYLISTFTGAIPVINSVFSIINFIIIACSSGTKDPITSKKRKRSTPLFDKPLGLIGKPDLGKKFEVAYDRKSILPPVKSNSSFQTNSVSTAYHSTVASNITRPSIHGRTNWSSK